MTTGNHPKPPDPVSSPSMESPSGKPQGRRDDDPYVSRILEAASELFAAHGLESVSMHQIAKKAGIGQGSLYRRYADKGEICGHLLLTSTEQILTDLEQSALNRPESMPAMDGLAECIRHVVDFIEIHADLLQLMKSEFTGKKQLTQFEHPFFRRLNAIILIYLEDASRSGELTGLDPRFAATALLSVLSPDLYLYQQKIHGSSKDDILRGIQTLFISGLRGL